MKAAIYAQTTALKQVDKRQSITRKMAYLESYCAENNLKVVRRYSDIGSGKDFNATGWKDLLNELTNGNHKVKRLVCTSTDRYSRTILEAMHLVQRLNSRGIQIIFIDEEVDVSPYNQSKKS